MNDKLKILVDVAHSPIAMRSTADLMLERSKWAGQIFQRYDHKQVDAIINAVADAAYEKAGYYAEWAVRETGFGVVKDKKLKNQLSSKGLLAFYRDDDFVTPRVNQQTGIIEIPKPAGVVFALAPSTNPVATVNYKILLALMTRNAIVLSPHPGAAQCCVSAAKLLEQAAVEAGAPEGIIQIIERPSIPLVNEFMQSLKTDVILATGGNAMVRAAYSSSNPALGVGPGNAPVFVDSSADMEKAAKHIVASKSFDNSLLCTNESVLITLKSCAQQVRDQLTRAKAYICNDEERDALRAYLFNDKGFNIESIGQDATWIAQQAGISVPTDTRILVAPIDKIGLDEKLSKEKLCPVLGLFTIGTRRQAIAQARAQLRMTGAGHSAAIHCADEQVVMAYASAVEVYRVIVNAPCSQGAAGFATDLAPSFTIGTGYFGRSSVGENVGPQHLVHWTRVAHFNEALVGADDDPAVDDNNLDVLSEPLKDEAQQPDNHCSQSGQPSNQKTSDLSPADMRVEIRRMIAEELRDLLKG